jgi:hypothetical protein
MKAGTQVRITEFLHPHRGEFGRAACAAPAAPLILRGLFGN